MVNKKSKNQVRIAIIISRHAFLRKHQPIEQGYLNIADEILAMLEHNKEGE